MVSFWDTEHCECGVHLLLKIAPDSWPSSQQTDLLTPFPPCPASQSEIDSRCSACFDSVQFLHHPPYHLPYLPFALLVRQPQQSLSLCRNKKQTVNVPIFQHLDCTPMLISNWTHRAAWKGKAAEVQNNQCDVSTWVSYYLLQHAQVGVEHAILAAMHSTLLKWRESTNYQWDKDIL